MEIKDRNHSIVVKHVPVSFQTGLEAELRKAKDTNNLTSKSLLSAK